MKKDTITITIIILSIILLFAIFSINKKEPTKKTTKKAYEQIEEESNNIDKNKRKNLQEITLEQYEEIVNKKGKNIVVFIQENCKYCEAAIPILENISYEEKINIKYINLSTLTIKEKEKLLKINKEFEEGITTPLIEIYNNGKYKIAGLAPKESYIQIFKKYNLIGE